MGQIADYGRDVGQWVAMGVASTHTTPLCINCGFVGAIIHVGFMGPYCTRCARQARSEAAEKGRE